VTAPVVLFCRFCGRPIRDLDRFPGFCSRSCQRRQEAAIEKLRNTSPEAARE
jgi:hypothetical protein